MIPVRIHDANVILSQPEEWDTKLGDCDALFVRREERGDTQFNFSAWKPSAHELETLILGGSVVLGIVGQGHPPVMLYVSAED